MLTNKSDDLSLITRTQEKRALSSESRPLTATYVLWSAVPPQPPNTNKLIKTFSKSYKNCDWTPCVFIFIFPHLAYLLIPISIISIYITSSYFSLHPYISNHFWSLQVTQGFRRELPMQVILWPPEAPRCVCLLSFVYFLALKHRHTKIK